MGKIPNLSDIFQMGWNHQQDCFDLILLKFHIRCYTSEVSTWNSENQPLGTGDVFFGKPIKFPGDSFSVTQLDPLNMEVTYNLTVKSVTSSQKGHTEMPASPKSAESPLFCLPGSCDKSLEEERACSCSLEGNCDPEISMEISTSLRLIGPSYGGVWLSIAGFWDLQTTSFEIPWFLGLFYSSKFPHVGRIVRSLDDWIYWIEVSCWPPPDQQNIMKHNETSSWREEGWKWLADEHAANTKKPSVDPNIH